MSLTGVARETLHIVQAGGYTAPSGAAVDFAAAQRAAVAGTRLYDPAQAAALLAAPPGTGAPPRVEVTDETTQVAAARLAAAGPVAALNFASARNPGGGFLGGAKAQEEDVCRCSGLYHCLLEAPDYYAVNRAGASLLYSDHVIWSPAVPFFRTRARELLEAPFFASVITAPAPNAGEALRRDPAAGPAIEACYRHRAGLVLAVAQAQAARRLVLGAWGCGVFRNDPAMAADAFGVWLASPRFAGAFDAVTFAVYDPSKTRGTLAAFADRLSPTA
ncbi:MAG: TIGR02452 family protein [Myxococcales bacterium]|nr:TIGR02452 family protein [Myxococcales bacterium]